MKPDQITITDVSYADDTDARQAPAVVTFQVRITTTSPLPHLYLTTPSPLPLPYLTTPSPPAVVTFQVRILNIFTFRTIETLLSIGPPFRTFYLTLPLAAPSPR